MPATSQREYQLWCCSLLTFSPVSVCLSTSASLQTSPSPTRTACLSLLWLFLEQVVVSRFGHCWLQVSDILCTSNVNWFFTSMMNYARSTNEWIHLIIEGVIKGCSARGWGGKRHDGTKEQHVKLFRWKYAEQMRQQSRGEQQDLNWSRQEAERSWHFIDRISRVTGCSRLREWTAW